MKIVGNWEIFFFVSLFVLHLLLFPTILHSGGTYWGTSGLIRVPNGRVIEDGNLRLTFSQSYPYRNLSATFGFFPFLELNGRITEVLSRELNVPGWKEYGNYKDKSADFKLLLFKERKFLPSLSIGAQDFHGTQLFYNEYVVASKKFKDLDFTMGYGGNLFGSLFREEDTEVRELNGIFGGVEWEVKPNLSFLVEYDPTKKLARVDGTEIESHYNIGLRWKPFRWLNTGYSFQRGKEHSFSMAFIYPFGKSFIPQKSDEPFYGPVNHTPLISSLLKAGITSRLVKIRNYLDEEGFSNVEVTLSDDLKQLYVEYENKKYLSQVKALGRVLRVIAAQSPSDIELIHIIVKSEGIPMLEISLSPEDLINCLNREISFKEMLERSKITSIVSRYGSEHWDGDITVGEKEKPLFSYQFKPFEIESYLNDPSGFFKARIGPTLLLKEEFGKGLSIETSLRFPFYSNVGTNLAPISSEPIRSDIVDYLSGTGMFVENLFLNKFFRLGDNTFYRITAGYLELQFAGISTEYLRIFKGGRFALGTELTYARKRDPDSLFGLKDFSAVTPLLNGYVYVPEMDTTLQASAGRFLAGDKGVRFQITRHLRGGSVFLWYTKTDTTKFAGPNKDYSDKGIGFVLPIRVFKNYDCQGSYAYSLSPWSRDVGQEVSQVYGLYDFIREFTPLSITSHWKEIIE